MSGRTAEDYEDDYTDPELRARLKEEIKAGDRGGRLGQSGTRQHVPDTEAAREARRAAELLDVPAPEARRRVAGLHGETQLDRAQRAERDLGTNRKTVLGRIEQQRAADDRDPSGD
ncbi:hypothetical protein IN07_19000 [Modestobacter caceresii]|uniref:Uncharacterized protein n=1 Tax=Modestobacter caceresii TaxID=1522368 RepID=A0A098Y5Q9_9ACTN|nr:hypothetical protein [Modestobacter caceresii]KGH45056.1 hypothetical protein IN07_19000 [Modestobacter caceresii]